MRLKSICIVSGFRHRVITEATSALFLGPASENIPTDVCALRRLGSSCSDHNVTKFAQNKTQRF